jgi:hypothetical protein
MTTDFNRFSFVSESLGDVFHFLVVLAKDDYVRTFNVREISGVQLVHVITDAQMTCMLDAMSAGDDELMLPTLRQLGRVEHTAAD